MNSLHYLLMVDISQSMAEYEHPLKKYLIEHYAQLLQQLSKHPSFIRGSIHLGFFNDQIQAIAPVSNLGPLEEQLKLIKCSGQTAIYDAIGEGEKYLQCQKSFDRKLLILLTDGHENASKNFTKNSIQALQVSSELKINLIGAGWNMDNPIEKYPVHGMIVHQIDQVNFKEIFSLILSIYQNS